MVHVTQEKIHRFVLIVLKCCMIDENYLLSRTWQVIIIDFENLVVFAPLDQWHMIINDLITEWMLLEFIMWTTASWLSNSIHSKSCNTCMPSIQYSSSFILFTAQFIFQRCPTIAFHHSNLYKEKKENTFLAIVQLFMPGLP